MNATSANNTIITQPITRLIWNYIGQVDGLALGDRGWWCFFCKQLLDSFQVTPRTFPRRLVAQGLRVCSPPGLCSDLQPCPHVSSGENSGDLITKVKGYKNPFKPSLGNTLFHILTNVNGTCSTSSFPNCIAFLQACSHCGRDMPARPKILACTEARSPFFRWKRSAEWVTSHAQVH